MYTVIVSLTFLLVYLSVCHVHIYIYMTQCSLVPRPSPSSAPCALRVIIKCGGGKTEAEGRDPRHRCHKLLSKIGMMLVAY